MRKIREGFESNSSSSHSLILGASETPLIKDLEQLGTVDREGNFVITGNTRFGWEWEVWSSPADKAMYLRIDRQHDDDAVSRLREVIAAHAGVKPEEVVFEGVDEEDSQSYDYYIDHQSAGTSHPIFEEDDEFIWSFLMNPDSEIRGGNDNSDGPWDTF